MSETSETYSRWYDTATRAGDDAIHMTNNHRSIPAPSERAALAQRARQSARWMLYLAETLELRQPGDHQ